ncbi:MAG: M23 family metallopeptidase [Clostridiales bacterium]|jgi:murein DD-endopeptidase MepM/ murein hydrolase activator NlpD|nr:M23 family metallopeptidase [Clostridiales bacterium]
MNDKGSKRKGGITGKAGFYAVLYSVIGVMLVAVAALGYVSLNGGGSTDGQSQADDLGRPSLASNGDAAAVNNPGDQTLADAREEDVISKRPTVTAAPNTTTTAKPKPTPSAAPTPVPATAPPTATPAPTPQAEIPDDPEGGMAEEPWDDPDRTFAAFDPDQKMTWPVIGEIVMPFSTDALVFDKTLEQYRTNDNVAISAASGSPAVAASAGRVTDVSSTRESGGTVTIDHGNGWSTTYSQLADDIAVGLDDVVEAGQVLGYVGEPSIYSVMLGSHLDFEVTKDSVPVDPGDLLADQ